MSDETPRDESDTYYRAVTSRDPRFDGRFFTGVTTTGIYCRPICPARTPKRENVRFFRVAAAAEAAGFRTCRRCRPDKAPGSPDWNVRADLAGRALRLIADGACDQEDGVAALAATLAVSERHLHRVLVAELGVGPLTLARSRRAQTARLLLESTSLPVSDVAFAAGFGSIRQFNDSVREAFGATPSEIRARFGGAPAGHDGSAVEGDGALTLRLGYRAPLDVGNLFGWFGARAVPGVDELVRVGPDLVYRRGIRLPHGTGTVELRDDGHAVHARLAVEDLRDVAVAVRRCRDLLDLDADPGQIGLVLAADPVLAPLVARWPGLRVPGCFDGFEIAVRAIVGQQVSVAAARTLAARIAERFRFVEDGAGAAGMAGTAGADAAGTPGAAGAASARAAGMTGAADPGHLVPFPSAETLAEGDLGGLGMTTRGAATIQALARAVASGEISLDRGVDRAATRAGLLALPGVGPWTADYVALRAFGDPDAFPVGDLVLRKQAAALGLPEREKDLTAHAERWRPWRAYAAVHLWAAASPDDTSSEDGTR